mmetsp:Transcript_11770/g.36316  ORF Transcript_11770/g.36316 Transcript_11770/m.36316 type:complete len:524 (-) Transcript_11770:190-1761(-)
MVGDNPNDAVVLLVTLLTVPALAEWLYLRSRTRLQQTCTALHAELSLQLLPRSIPTLDAFDISRPVLIATDLTRTIPRDPQADTELLESAYPDARPWSDIVIGRPRRMFILHWLLSDMDTFSNICKAMTALMVALYCCPLFFVVWSAYLPYNRSAGPFGKTAAASLTWMLYNVPIFANLLQFLISTGLLSAGMNDPRIIQVDIDGQTHTRVVSNAWILHVLMNFMVLGDYFTQRGLMNKMLCMTACCLQQLVYFRNVMLQEGLTVHSDVVDEVQSYIRQDTEIWLEFFPAAPAVGRGGDYPGGAIVDNGVTFTILFCPQQQDILFVNNNLATLEQAVGFTLEAQVAPLSNILGGFSLVTKRIEALPGRSANSLLPLRACMQPSSVVDGGFHLLEIRIDAGEAQWDSLFGAQSPATETELARSFTDAALFGGQRLFDDGLLPLLPGASVRTRLFSIAALHNLKKGFFGLYSNPMWWAKRVAAHDGLNEPRGDSFVCWLRYDEDQPDLCPDYESDATEYEQDDDD